MIRANRKFEWFRRIGLTRFKNRGCNCEWFARIDSRESRCESPMPLSITPTQSRDNPSKIVFFFPTFEAGHAPFDATLLLGRGFGSIGSVQFWGRALKVWAPAGSAGNLQPYGKPDPSILACLDLLAFCLLRFSFFCASRILRVVFFAVYICTAWDRSTAHMFAQNGLLLKMAFYDNFITK